MFKRVCLFIICISTAWSCWAAQATPYARCYEAASAEYGIDAQLLRALAIVESSENPAAVNRGHQARTGTIDIGLMQINSGHLTKLSRYGISKADLFQPCTAVNVGAWILADLIRRHGPTWNAVGAYNAACTQLRGEACTKARSRYVNKVQRALSRIASQRPGTSPADSRRELVAMRFDTQGGTQQPASLQSITFER